MKRVYTTTAILIALTLLGCNRQEKNQKTKLSESRFIIEISRKITPVKDQGSSSICWAYAMLSMIESEHLAKGDSVNLSTFFVLRELLNQHFNTYYLKGGTRNFNVRGVGQTLINYIERFGVVPYDSYPDNPDADIPNLRDDLKSLAINAINHKTGLHTPQKYVDEKLDDALGPMPISVHMLGATYTPIEFAHSVCGPDEYIGITSFTHHPFYQNFTLQVPDNWENNQFYNVPMDTMENYVIKALRSGHTAVWEGDVSEDGFSFKQGIAKLTDMNPVTQKRRQMAFETFETTDDHCMHIIGIAHNLHGKRFFIMKNSSGTGNPYKGMMFMSERYFKLKTIAVYMPT